MFDPGRPTYPITSGVITLLLAISCLLRLRLRAVVALVCCLELLEGISD